MVYITADGKVHEGERPRSLPYKYAYSLKQTFSNLQPRWKAFIVAVVAITLRYWLNSNPLANGKIPAADVAPADHWNKIKSDDTFMRRLTAHLGGNRNRQLEDELKMTSGKLEIVMDLVDFGGVDGHRAEKTSWNDIESIRGTRCSTTSSAVTAYFCGQDVATNQDVALGTKRKPSNIGIQPFSEFITCRHKQGERNGGIHRRAVYRIGVGCEDSLAGYSHAFNIVAQPDGSFFWLQSFISQYSLQAWMDNMDVDGTPSGHLSLDELLGKLQKVEYLMDISSWTSHANSHYNELFGVDMEEQALKRGKPPISQTWEFTHRLSTFVWDEACEYPLPPQHHHEGDRGDKSKNKNASYQHDECNMLLGRHLLEEIKKLNKLL